MKTYVKPMSVALGKSEELIKGDCGWGGETWRLNKAGSVKQKRRRKVKQACNPNVSKDIICEVCISVDVCGPTGHTCP